MTDRYRAAEVQIDGQRVAAVLDNARAGERFCLIDPRHCFDASLGGADAALARAKDIADVFNRVERINDVDQFIANRREEIRRGARPTHIRFRL